LGRKHVHIMTDEDIERVLSNCTCLIAIEALKIFGGISNLPTGPRILQKMRYLLVSARTNYMHLPMHYLYQPCHPAFDTESHTCKKLCSEEVQRVYFSTCTVLKICPDQGHSFTVGDIISDSFKDFSASLAIKYPF
jgi:hypothetical protein